MGRIMHPTASFADGQTRGRRLASFRHHDAPCRTGNLRRPQGASPQAVRSRRWRRQEPTPTHRKWRIM